MITITADSKPVKIEWIEFSDGALTCKVDPIAAEAKREIVLFVNPSTPCKQIIEELNLVWDALFHLNKGKVDSMVLYLEYLPYARADRVFEEGNPNPLSVFLLEFSMFNFNTIILRDVHNKEAVISHPLYSDLNIKFINQLECFKSSIPHSLVRANWWTHVIAPDKGAKNKAKSIADYLGIPCIEASKKRDINTGKIIETTFDEELPAGSHVIVCDDILDGGGTFIPLAEKIRSQGCTVDLYVTHMIGAKGLDLFKGLYDNIHCYHTVGKHTNMLDVMNFNMGV